VKVSWITTELKMNKITSNTYPEFNLCTVLEVTLTSTGAETLNLINSEVNSWILKDTEMKLPVNYKEGSNYSNTLSFLIELFGKDTEDGKSFCSSIRLVT